MSRASVNPMFVQEGRPPAPAAPEQEPAPAPPRRRANLAARRRAALALVVLGVAGVLFARSSAAVFRPLAVAHRADVEVGQLRSQLDQEVVRNRRLRSQLEYLKTPAGVEEEARRKGWIRSGETALVIPPQAQSTK